MTDDQTQAVTDNRTYIDGHDLGVIICKIASIWIFFTFVYFALQVLPLLFGWLGTLFREDLYFSSSPTAVFANSATTLVGFGVYLAASVVLWKRADRISARILGTSCIRTVNLPFSSRTLLRIAMIFIGIWYAIPRLVHFAVTLFQVVWNWFVPPEPPPAGSFRVEYGDQSFSVDFTALFQSGVYLVICAFLVFGSGTIVSWLHRFKSIGLNH